MTISALVGIPLSYFWGWLDDKIGTKKSCYTLAVGFLLMSVAMVMARNGNIVIVAMAVIGIAAVHHIAAQQGFGQAVAHIAPRLAQLGHNIHQGGFAHAKCFAQGFGASALHPYRQALHRVRADLFGVTAAGFQQALGGGVAFGVDGGCIQRVLGTRQAQKACALFKCLGAKALDLFQLRTGGKRALLLTPSHNIFSGSVGNAGHTGQQRGGRRVQIHANAVHTVFHHTVQRFVQALLGHIMLVLAHAHGLGVDFNQFGQRVLQAARNGHRAAQVDIILRELLRRQLGRRIHRSTGFTDDHILQVQPLFLGQFTDYGGGKLLGFMPGGAIADGPSRPAPPGAGRS